MPNPLGDISPPLGMMYHARTRSHLIPGSRERKPRPNHMPRTTAKTKLTQTTAQQLGSLIKSARDIMRTDKG